jgi:hypothetical protein
MTPTALFTLLAVVAVSFEAPMVATVFGAVAFWVSGHGG